MAQTPEQMEATMVDNLEAKTGRTLAQWLDLAAQSKLARHGEIVQHLKAQHGLTHGYANLVAHRFLRAAEGKTPSAGDLVDAQYAGAKAGLRPIYDRLLAEVGKLGKDVEVAPKKAYVSLRRSKQFATIQPSTKTRMDVGLNLKGVKASGRLQPATGMVTHKVEVTGVQDIDADLKGWIRQAYEGA